MDKTVLVKYCDMKEEIKDLRKRITDLEIKIASLSEVSDMVKGTRKDGTIGSTKITGYPYPEYYEKEASLRKRKAKLELLEIELLEITNWVKDYINIVPDSRMRNIIDF